MAAAQLLDNLISINHRIDPYYDLQLKENHLLIINKSSKLPKYKIPVHNWHSEELVIIQKWSSGSAIEHQLREIELAGRQSNLLALIRHLKDKIFIELKNYKIRNWLYNGLSQYQDMISPREHYHLYQNLVKKTENDHFHFIFSQEFIDLPFTKRLMDIGSFSKLNEDVFQHEIKNRWVIIAANQELNYYQQQQIYRLGESNPFILAFTLDPKKQRMLMGPRINQKIHGCLHCIDSIDEKIIEHSASAGTTDDELKDYFLKAIKSEMLDLMIDESYHYNSGFSSIIGKQFIFDLQKDYVAYKQIRKNIACPVCKNMALKGGEKDEKRIEFRFGF
ncbi:hypothetical protein [Cytobacillus gottheilii]|uniref:hypothetical protein n=1 Tax=Cytobacillus gottheilii TaxID=859144 RepID=UPI00249586D9|nr:hypothetical protein [Cytobacillus gottheilii]